MRQPVVQTTHNSPKETEDSGSRSALPAEGSFSGLKIAYEELSARVEELERENRDLKKFKGGQKELEQRLSDALTKVLGGYLPICARCKRIREENGVWKQLETYIQAHTEVVFSHSLCPKCAKSFYPEFFTPEE